MRKIIDIPEENKVLEKLQILAIKAKKDLKNYRVFVYVLVKEIHDALERIVFLKEKGCSPFAQPYRDFILNTEPTKEQKRVARWVNHKTVFNKVEFKNYK